MRDGIYNARITGTFLGYEDHGLLIMQIEVEYGDGARQGYQRILGSRKEVSGQSMKFIRDALDAIGAESWEQLKRKSCRADVRGGLIAHLGHFLEEKWTADEGV